MKRLKLKYFTLPEVTMAIAILGIGLLSILGVFPVAIKSGNQAVKISECIHKARAVATLWQTFSKEAPPIGAEPIPYEIQIEPAVQAFAFTDTDGDPTTQDHLGGGGLKLDIPLVAVDRQGHKILDKSDNEIKGLTNVSTGFLNDRLQLDRVFLTVNDEFDTYFYVIRAKKPK